MYIHNLFDSQVLNTCTTRSSAIGATNGKFVDTPDSSKAKPLDLDDLPRAKRARIVEKCTYDDLADDQPIAVHATQLNLAKVERYLHGPVPDANTNSGYPPNAEMLDLTATHYNIQQEKETWNTRTPHKVLVSATAAVNALGELSPGGALMRGFQEQSLARKLQLFNV